MTIYRFQHFHGTAAEWTASGEVLHPGEMGLWLDAAGRVAGIKFGDGVSLPDELPFFTSGEAPAVGPATSPPVSLAPPVLSGSGTIGQALAVDPGQWGGQPAPTFGYQWLRGSTAISGEAGAVYVPVAADDGQQVRARVSGSNAAGSLSAETAAVTVRYAPPAAVGTILPQSFVIGSGGGFRTVETAHAFAGSGLTFSASGGGATAHPQTGVVTVPTGAAADTTVTVTAGNSGGSATAPFAVTVTAAPAEPNPPGPGPADPGNVAYEGQAPHVTVSTTPDLIAAIDARIANPGTGGDYIIELGNTVFARHNGGNSETRGVEIIGKHYPGPGRIILRAADHPDAVRSRFRRLELRNCRRFIVAYAHVDRSNWPAANENHPFNALRASGCQDVLLYRCRVTGQPDRPSGIYTLNFGINVDGLRVVARECSVSHGFFKAYNLGGGSSHSGLIGCINEDRTDDDYVLGGGLTEDCFIIDCWGGRVSNPTPGAHMDFIQGHDWRMNGADNRRLRIRGNVILCGDTGTHINGIVFYGTKTSDVVVEQNLVGISNNTGVRFTGPEHVNPDHQDNTFLGMPGANASFVHTQVMGPPNGWRAIDTYFNQHTPAPSGRGHLRLALSHGNNLSPYGTVMAEIPHISKDLFALRPLPGMRSHWTHEQNVGPTARWREILEDANYPRVGPAAESFRRQYNPQGRLP